MEDLIRVACCSPEVFVSNPVKNRIEILKAINKHAKNADVIVFPELSITGYTCKDLFLKEELLNSSLKEVITLAKEIPRNKLVFVGCPLQLSNGKIVNCAFGLNDGVIKGIVPKQYLPNYKEFEEKRWFDQDLTEEIDIVLENNCHVPFGSKIIFLFGKARIAAEVCEDLFAPIPPSTFTAMAGANIIVNLSASNELIGKAEYRRRLVEQQSARTLSAYIYCSAGPTESTTDLVFGGHNIITENGSILKQSERFKDFSYIEYDIDVQKLNLERSGNPTFSDCQKRFVKPESFTWVPINLNPNLKQDILRPKVKNPFLSNDPKVMESVCDEIINIQICALKKRLSRLSSSKTVIAVSGGSDSTVALLSLCAAYDSLGFSRKDILGITMPGFGTSNRTKNNSDALMASLGITQKVIDIKPTATQTFIDMNHIPFKDYNITIDGIKMSVEEYFRGKPSNLTVEEISKVLNYLPSNAKDLTFENVQARLRTFYAMSSGFTVGTGDLSEAALGWCTYNGDHMSMYNPNCTIPKTLIKSLILHFANNYSNYFTQELSGDLSKILKSIYETVISPELLPLKDGEIVQSSEESVGSYNLNDFFLYNFIRNNFCFSKILDYAVHSYEDEYTKEEIEKWLKLFFKRFFQAQFKRSCCPDGPKVGSVGLSPRGDWRMPSDADFDLWCNNE